LIAAGLHVRPISLNSAVTISNDCIADDITSPTDYGTSGYIGNPGDAIVPVPDHAGAAVPRTRGTRSERDVDKAARL